MSQFIRKQDAERPMKGQRPVHFSIYSLRCSALASVLSTVKMALPTSTDVIKDDNDPQGHPQAHFPRDSVNVITVLITTVTTELISTCHSMCLSCMNETGKAEVEQ